MVPKNLKVIDSSAGALLHFNLYFLSGWIDNCNILSFLVDEESLIHLRVYEKALDTKLAKFNIHEDFRRFLINILSEELIGRCIEVAVKGREVNHVPEGLTISLE